MSQPATSTLAMPDGIRLFVKRDAATSKVRAWVLLLHGFAEHSGLYQHVIDHFNVHDVGVVTYDHRGHGRSSGPRAYVDQFDQYVEDAVRIAQDVPAPFFLMGHSMGGLIAALATPHLHDQLRGLILSSPALALPEPQWLQHLSGAVGRWAPKLPVAKLDRRYLSHDAKVVQHAKHDPLNYHGPVKARLAAEMVRASGEARQLADRIDLPLFLFHGTADQITDPKGTAHLYDHSPSTDKVLHLLEGLYHETLNEPEQDLVLSLITDWLLERSTAFT